MDPPPKDDSSKSTKKMDIVPTWRTRITDSTNPSASRQHDDITPALRAVVQTQMSFFWDLYGFQFSNTLKEAVNTGDISVVNTVLHAGATGNFDAQSPFLDTLCAMDADEPAPFKIMMRLLKEEKDITSTETYFSPEALQAAVGNGQHEEVERLQKNEKMLKDIQNRKDSALRTAAKENDLRIVKVLIEAGANVNACSPYSGGNAITEAASAGYLEMVDYLLSIGAEVNLEKNSPLGVAAAEGHLAVVVRLLQAGSRLDGALAEAARNGQLAIVRRLLEAGASVEGGKYDSSKEKDGDFTALIRAAEGGHFQIVEFLLASRGDLSVLPEKAGREALRAAAQKGLPEVVKLLLAAGADINHPKHDYRYTPLQCAVKSGSLETVNLLLDAGCDIEPPNGNGSYMSVNTALSFAAEQGNLDIVKRLLMKMDAGHKATSKITLAYCGRAIYDAVSKDKEDVARHLLSIGTPVTTNNGYYDGILERAVSSGNFAIVKLLVEAKADLESTHCGRWNPTALQVSVGRKRLDMAEYLIAAGANVNAGNGGRTKSALHTACQSGELSLVKVLLDAGADVDAVTYEGQTVLQAAEKGGNEDVLTLLKAKQEQLAIVAAKSIESTWEVVEKPLVAEGASLCSVCEEKLFDLFIPSKRSFNRSKTWHPSLTSLEASVKAGCVFCNFFRRQIGTKELKIPQPSPVPLSIWSKGNVMKKDTEPLDFSAQSQITEPFPDNVERPRELITRFCYNVEPFEAKRKPLPGSTSSIETFSQIRTWINTCIDRHECCKHLQQPNFLPPRLLDLEPSSHKDDVELVSTEALSPKDTKYMTLSHCHHDLLEGFIPKTSMQALHDLDPATIEICDLPPLFVDAIRVTKSLSVRYLWIDTLCTLENADEDKRLTSDLINEIFNSSYCTIAAASTQCSEAEDGFFCTIPTDDITAKFEVTSKAGEKKRIQVIKEQPGWMWKYKNSALSKSVTGLLERELSPRVLHFTETEVLWECRYNKAMETWPGENMPEHWPRAEPRILDSFADLGEGSVYDLWHKAVAEFTARPTEDEREALFYLGCLAQVLRAKFEGRYIAGIWERDIMRRWEFCYNPPPPSCRRISRTLTKTFQTA
ncbi:ankyrin repeat-containing domain protein [Halenospora varia]|nr:ankyrin repeat-containing domain protein [Halenospora varia]